MSNIKKFFLIKKEVGEIYKKKIYVFLPIIILEFYLFLGYLLYLIGPWEFPYRYDSKTGIFVFVVHIAILLGFIYAVKHFHFSKLKAVDFNKYYNKILCLGYLFFIPWCFYKTGVFFPPMNLFGQPGKAYTEIISLINQRPAYFNIIGMGFIICYFNFVLPFYYWSELKYKKKILSIILCIGFMSIELCTGKNIGIAIYIISVAVIVLAKYLKKSSNNKTANFKYYIVVIFCCAIIIGFFEYNLKGRTSNDIPEEVSYEKEITLTEINEKYFGKPEFQKLAPTNKLIDNYNYYANSLPAYYRLPDAMTYLHVNNPIYQAIPENMRFIYSFGSSYLSQGYHGLTLSLYQTHSYTFGLSHLKFIDYYLQKLFGINLTKGSLENEIIASGYPVGLTWMTVYPQFISDFGIYGTILAMYLLGWLFGTLWVETVDGKNFISVILFAFLCVQFFFITSWWYLGLTGGFFITFYLPLAIWIKLRIKKN